jgi:hypothetical protein
MELLCCNVAALAVAFLYYTWRAYHQARRARERVLRERVTYMLWVMADRIESGSRPVFVVRPG